MRLRALVAKFFALLLFGLVGFGCHWSPGQTWKAELEGYLDGDDVQGMIVGRESRYWVSWFERSGFPTGASLKRHSGPVEELRATKGQTMDFVIIQTSHLSREELLATCTLCWDPLKEGGKLFFEGPRSQVQDGFMEVYKLGIEVLHEDPLILRRRPGSPEYGEVM